MKHQDIGFGNHFYVIAFQVLHRTLFYYICLPALPPSPPDVLNFYYYILEPILATRYEVENERDVRPTPHGAFLSYG